MRKRWERLGRPGRIGVVAGAVVLFLIILGAIGSATEDTTKTTSATEENTETTSATTRALREQRGTPSTGAPTTTNRRPATTERPAPPPAPPTAKPPPSQADVLRKDISDALGKSNRKVPRVVEVTSEPALRVIVKWAINENLTEGLTKDTARLDGVKILRAIRDAKPNYDGVFLEGTYSLQDRFGNASEETVVRASYSRATVERINFDNFDFKNVYEIADSAEVHPAFRY